MRFNIPIEKDDTFAFSLFDLLAQNLSDLRNEAGKWPDRLTFSGPLGKEVHSYVVEKAWDLKKFNPIVSNGIVNQIIIDYSKPITQIDDSGATIFDESLNNRIINNVPGKETMQKVLSKYAAPSFKIERQIRPSIEIELIRKKNV